jgi:regulatory protein
VAPRVTALVAEPRDRVRVDLDGAPWRVLPAAAVVGARLAVGTELDRPRARELRRELRRVEALALATAALARRDHSKVELAGKLERRGVAPHEQARALDALERSGYLDDTRFASSRAATLAARGYGNVAIRFDLERHGVAGDEIEGAVAALPGEEDRAAAYVERAGASPKSARRLAAKGFSVESVESALGGSLDDPF